MPEGLDNLQRSSYGLLKEQESGGKMRTASPSQVLAGAVRQFRGQKGWSQERLSQVLDGLGVKLHPTAIVKIERGTRGVSVDEAFALAAALEVAPVHLLVPLEDDALVKVTPERVVPAEQVRAWVRGRLEIDDGSERWYYFAVPSSEFPPTTVTFEHVDDAGKVVREQVVEGSRRYRRRASSPQWRQV